MIYSVAVASYEDVTSSMGEIVTTYIVQVRFAIRNGKFFILCFCALKVFYSPKQSYILSKRYSDFSSLYISLKDLLPLTYKFPNKSIFNNNSQFTKDRRLRGFDELLKRLLKVDPKGTELQSFLEIPDRLSLFNSIKDETFKTPGKHVDSEILSSPPQALHSNEKFLGNSLDAIDDDHDGSSDDYDSDFHDAVDNHVDSLDSDDIAFTQINDAVRKDFMYILRSSFKTTTCFYIFSILFRIVDISKASYYQILLTMVALGLLCTYVRIRWFKVKTLRNKKKKIV